MIRYKTYIVREYLSTIEKQSKEIKALMAAIFYRKFPNLIKLAPLEKYLKFIKVDEDVMKTFYQTYIDYINKCSLYHYRDYEREDIIKNINEKLGVKVR